MRSFKSNADNPWNLFLSAGDTERVENKSNESRLPNCVLENFLSSSIPLSFSRNQNVVSCDLCKVFVTKNRFKQHYEDRHVSTTSARTMIPFEEDLLTHDKSHKIKKIKRNRKKRTNFKEKINYPIEFIEKKKCKKVKIRTVNKRLHSKSFLDRANYSNKSKKLKLEHSDVVVDKRGYLVMDEGFMSSSPKLLDDHFYGDNETKKTNLSFDMFNVFNVFNDGVYCSNDSVHRTCSDSSTPPSLSLGTLQTLSSPASLNILNDPSSVVTEHYFLPSNDLTPERTSVSCKYQIDSLPWENFPSISKREENYNDYSVKHSGISLALSLEEEDGEVERAVQSITSLCDGFQIDFAAHMKMQCTGSPGVELQHPPEMFSSEETSMIDCFLDEVLGTSNKDHMLEFGACSSSALPSTCNQHSQMDSLMMYECNNLSEYQIDSNILNNFTSDYDEKFETLINNAMSEFVTQSPQNISSTHVSIDKNKPFDSFDPVKHCGVVAPNGVFCHRSLLCKLHTMPQKRQVERPESLTSLIKEIRDLNKIKRIQKKLAQSSNAFKSSNSSKTSTDSFNYNCSSTRSIEETSSFLDNRLSTPDLDLSVLNGISDAGATQTLNINVLDPKPLGKSRLQQDTVIHGNRTMVAMRSLLWRNRPKSSFRASQCRNGNFSHNLSLDSKTLPLNSSAHKNISIQNLNDSSDLSHMYKSNFGVSFPSDESRSRTTIRIADTGDNYGDNMSFTDGSYVTTVDKNCYSVGNIHSSRSTAGHVTCLPQDAQRVTGSLFVSDADFTVCSSSLNLSTPSMNGINHMSPGFFSNSIMNISPHFFSPGDTPINDVKVNNTLIFKEHNTSGGPFSATPGASNVTSDVASAGNKFISILDEGQGAGSILYPVGNPNQIMMVVNNKNGRLFSDQTELFNENFISVNQTNNISQHLSTVPLSSFLALKQNNGQNVHQDVNGSLSTPQIVSISPLELQRLSDNYNNSIGGQVITADCIGASHDTSNSIIYQLNQSHGASSFAPSSLAIKNESNSQAKPLTVQSSSLNGLTQKFVILPDGTISAFTQQPNGVKATFNQSSLLNRAPVQHQIFNQLSNYGQNQTYFINNDKIIIAPNSAVPGGIAQQIVMPQIINQSDMANHASSALTFVHPQQPPPTSLSSSSSSKISKVHSRSAQNHLPTQIPVESPQPKVSFQIQTTNQYSNQMPNTFFITAAHQHSGGTNMPMKQQQQQIFMQSSDHLGADISLLDSGGYFDGQCNNQHKSLAQLDNLSCNSDIRTINSSSQDFELVNHVLNPQSIFIQQPSGNIYSSKSMLQGSCQASLDLVSSTEGGGHSTTSNGHQQQIVVNNANEQFAQSQFKLSRRQLTSTSYINGTPHSTTMCANQGQTGYKSVPPPLVISHQLSNQAGSNQLRHKSVNDHSYHQVQQQQQQQQSLQQQKGAQLNQLVLDDSQFSNEYMIVQSLIA